MGFTIPYPRNGLVNYHHSRDKDLSIYGDYQLIGDSGAFSAHTEGASINVHELVDWGQRWAEHLCWVAALDVIRDPKATHRNWLTMRSRGLNAIPTVHFPARPALLDDYAKDGVRFIGLGGQVGVAEKSRMRWAVSIMRYARDKYPDMRFHGWGVTTEMSTLLPYYSVDSSSWYRGMIYGYTTIQDPQHLNIMHRLNHNGRDAYRLEMANLLSTYYNIDPASVAKACASSSNFSYPVLDLMCRSAAMREILLRRRHGAITPPPELAGQEDGPRLHLVIPAYYDQPAVWMAATLAAELAAQRAPAN